jgi:hypothetical protein
MDLDYEKLREYNDNPKYDIDIWFNTEYYIAHAIVGYGKYAGTKLYLKGFYSYTSALEEIVKLIIMIQDGT